MNVYEAIQNRRTIRKFKQIPISNDDIIKIIDAGRLAPTGANLQSLKYAIISEKTLRKKIFPYIKYAGYLPNWNPSFQESPAAFIAVLNDTEIKQTDSAECDSGAAIMSMILRATELGFGSVWLGSIQREEIKKNLKLDTKFDILYLLGLGHPDQRGKVVELTSSIKYYHDENQDIYVPKRSLENVIVKKQ